MLNMNYIETGYKNSYIESYNNTSFHITYDSCSCIIAVCSSSLHIATGIMYSR